MFFILFQRFKINICDLWSKASPILDHEILILQATENGIHIYQQQTQVFILKLQSS